MSLRTNPLNDQEELVVRLQRETTVTLAWIAKRLQMGTRTYLAHLLYWKRRGDK